MPKINKHILTGVLLAGALLVVGGAVLLGSHSARRNVRIGFETTLAHAYQAPRDSFPNANSAELSDLQQKIVELSRQEYNKKPVSFDANVRKYSQGYREAWCANFVSWIMNQAGQPLSNPNSGSWRIPGVNTLQEYFTQQERYVQAGKYRPQVGDVAIYTNGRSHTNIVIAVGGDKMTTVGGNETGHIRIHTQDFAYDTEGLSGFGTLAH